MTDPQTTDTGRSTGARDRRCAVVAAGVEPGPLVDALRSVPRTSVGDVCIFPAGGRGEPDADYLILAAGDGSRLAGLEDQIERWSGRRTRVLLAVPASKCAIAGELPRRADGLILLNGGLAYLEESLKLADDGYTVLSSAGAGGANGSSGPGCPAMLSRLGAGEHAILRPLAAGDSNRAIAEALDESEARVKSMVRAILVKLGCRNRTEAAVLAATVLLPLLDGPADGGAGPDGDDAASDDG